MKRCALGWGTWVVTVAALGLLAPTTAHAQVTGTTFKLLFAQGDPPGSSAAGDLEIWAVNDAGQFGFVTELTIGREGIFYWDGKTSKFLEDSSSAWTPGGTNNAELVAAALRTGSDDHSETHLWNMKTGKMTVLVKPDMPVPGGGTVELNGNRVGTRINQIGQVVADLTVAGAYAVVRVEPDGKFTLVARKGTDLGGGKTAENAASPDINLDGVVVFQDHPYDTAADTGIYRWENGTITALATPGMDVPGGGKVTNAEYPVINDAGDVAFRGTVDGDEALFLWRKSTGKLALIAKKGTDLGGGAIFTQVEGNRRHSVEINNSGLIVASVWIGDSDGGVLIYNINSGKTSLLVRTGQELGTGIGKVQGIANGRGITGWDVAINNNKDNNQVLFMAKVNDKETMLLATLPKTVP